MATEFRSSRGARVLVVSAVAGCALLLLGACSSRNPDTLIGMNVDENAAMMDANAAVEANLAGSPAVSSNDAQANAESQAQTSNASDEAANASAAEVTKTRRSTGQVNAVENSGSSPELNDVEGNQAGTEPDIPNTVSNE